MRKPWKKPAEYYCKVDVLPLALVVWVLLVIFLVDAKPFHERTGNLVRLKHVVPLSNALREDTLRVFIERDGKIFFQTMQVRLEDLPVRLQDAMSTASEKKVYVNADARARYGSVVSVVDAVGSARIRNVSFLKELKR